MEINIFDYSDYRKFLAEFFDAKKAKNPSYSHRVFAGKAGLGSPSHFRMIVKGERNLSYKTIEKFSQALQLKEREKKYFECLVRYAQTEDLSEKAAHFEDIWKLRSKIKVHSLERDKYNFLSQWHVVAIYSLIDTANFKADPEWIAKRLKNKIQPKMAQEALDLLEKLELVKKDSKKGFVQTAGAINTDDDTKNMAVYRYHTEMMKLAYESLRNDPIQAREMNGVTLSIPSNKLNMLKEKIRAFRKEITELSGTLTGGQEVYQLNVQLFALTKETEK